ncbi:Hypothetical predicted protein, partial [Pelobates cultripes]
MADRVSPRDQMSQLDAAPVASPDCPVSYTQMETLLTKLRVGTEQRFEHPNGVTIKNDVTKIDIRLNQVETIFDEQTNAHSDLESW